MRRLLSILGMAFAGTVLLRAQPLDSGPLAQPVDSPPLAQSLDSGPLAPALDLDAMRWRMVGPFRGGRALAATGVPNDPDRFYFGAVGGGVWRTDNAGRTWEPVFDLQPIASVGAIAVAPSDPRVLYVGTGEADMRSDITYGNGVYRSTDAGETWTHTGLSETRQIGRIVVDPRDPNVVFVAALGHAYGPNPERGVFRSRDGGRTWTRVLFHDENTGAIDVAMAPGNPRILLAALWQTRRPPWNVYPPSNGPGSGLYRSEDGGDTWSAVHGGLPSEKPGRIGIAFAPGDARRVYAIVDAKEGGLYASRDGGATWTRATGDRRIWERGWYFGGVTIDPSNPDVVYVCDTAMYRSSDGGRTFAPVKGAPGGDDYHQLWIDPANPRRMVLASDQGTVISVDGAKTWSSWYNQPTAQLYHVAVDDRFPYWLYGAQQDSGAVATPSRTDYRGITLRDWRPIAGGGESGSIAPDPSSPRMIFGGTAGRFDLETLQERSVDPTTALPGEYRRTWTLPLAFSPADPRTLYFSNQFVFRTADGGGHWEKVSPDLTRESPDVPATLDPATAADSAVKGPRRGVVYSIAPSPLSAADVWCGTDDGLIWRTRDSGKHWTNVTPPDLTAWSKVGVVEASHFDADTAYAAVDRHRLDDLRPWIYRTRDGGRTWSPIAQGIPVGSYVNVVREDPARRGLLFAGTETGVFVSFDDGQRWQPLRGNLPACSVRDIVVKHGDLVIATHGRSFWILDAIAPLEQMDAEFARSEAWLFTPTAAVRLHPALFQGTPEPKDEPSADNPPRGAILDYRLKAASGAPITIEILDAKGELVQRFASDDPAPPPDVARIRVTPDWMAAGAPPSAEPGLHRFVWNLRYAAAKDLPELTPSARFAGVWAPPGEYRVRLTAAGRSWTKPLRVVRDPRIPASDADLSRQFELAREIERVRVPLGRALQRANTLRKQAGDRGSSGAVASDAGARIDAIAGVRPDPETGESAEEDGATPTLRRVAGALERLQEEVESADDAPSRDDVAGFALRREEAARVLVRWEEAARTLGVR